MESPLDFVFNTSHLDPEAHLIHGHEAAIDADMHPREDEEE